MYSKNCPSCGKLMEYIDKYHLNRSIKNSSKCSRYCLGNTKLLHKICHKCNIEKPYSEFNKSNRSIDKLIPWCRECMILYQNKQYKLKSEKERNKKEKPTRNCPSCGDKIEYNSMSNYLLAIKMNKKCSCECNGKIKENHRICTDCKIEKPYSDFGTDTENKIGLKAQCKLCYSLYYADYRKRNPINTTNNNNNATRKRRANKLAVKENYTVADEQITLSIFGRECFRCDSKNSIAIDHHLPLSKGNPLTVKNAVPLCMPCNSSKGTKDPQDFYTPKELKQIKSLFKKAAKAKNQLPK